MLDVIKGFVVTALTWALTLWYVINFPSAAAFVWGLASVCFVLPVVLPNGRWLFGHLVFCAGAFAYLLKSAGGDDRGFGFVLLMYAALATLLGIAARYAIRLARMWYRERTNAPPVPEKTLPPISVRSVLLTAGAVAALLMIYSVYVMFSASASAERLAAGRPYCVQVASNGNYRSVTNRLDLLGFRMWAGDHAVLAVRNGGRLDFYHWSYFNDTFDLDGERAVPIYCDVIPDFLMHPRRYRQEAEDSLSFLLMGQSFSIPKGYAPTVSGSGYLQIEMPSLGNVDLTVGRAGQLEGWRTTPRWGWRVESLGNEHDLIKERLHSPDFRHKPGLQFYELDSLGRVKTLVLCGEGANAGWCTHLFTDGRLSYNFHHPSAELSNWRQMQELLTTSAAKFAEPSSPVAER